MLSLSQRSERTVPALRTRRRPRQARSQVTVSSIVEATERVLLKRGYAGCTTKEVAEVAGVGIGSLYEYFPNKEALIAAVMEREANRYMEVLKREMLGTFERPFATSLPLALRAALDALEDKRALVGLLIREYPYIGPLAELSALPLRATKLASFCLHQFRDEVGEHDASTCEVLANMVIGAYLSRVVAEPGQSAEAFLATLETILLKVLISGNSGRHAASIDEAE